MKDRIKTIDYIRTISILAVVLIHTTTRTLEVSKYNLIGFPLTIFLNQISRFAVPLFFILSGFVLEYSWDNKLNYFSFIKKRLSKVIIPYIFWSAIYYFFIYNQNRDNFFKVILTGDASYQLYFIPTLCVFYLIFPILHKLYHLMASFAYNCHSHVNGNLFKLALVFLGGLETWLLYQDYLVKQFKFVGPIRIVILSWFFFLVGIFAVHNKERILFVAQKLKYIIFTLTFGSGFYVYWQGVHDFLIDGSWLNFYSQWRPSVLIYSILISLSFYYFFERYQFVFFEKLSKYSFFVFFVHVAVLEIFWKMVGMSTFNSLTTNMFGKVVFDLIFFGVVSTLSFLIAGVVHKIPKLSKITG